jgi:hypothetical protein
VHNYRRELARDSGYCSNGQVHTLEAPIDPFATLNAAQRAAVGCTSDAPLLIIAGAGTGKTTTLAHRIAKLVIDGADPRRILLLTFSRRAAQEMIRRAQRLARYADLPWAGTFHAVGSRLLRLHANALGLDPSFTVLDRDDAADLMDLVRADGAFAKGERRSAQGHLSVDLLAHGQRADHARGSSCCPASGRRSRGARSTRSWR